jgi:apolipoprotein N-acyltransferase
MLGRQHQQESIVQKSLADTELNAEELLRRPERPVPAPRSSWVWLAIAATLLLFAYGADNVPLAAWLAPVFLLRFLRTQSFKVGVPIAYVVLVATCAFQLRGMVPIPGIGYYIFFGVWGLVLVLPYVMDRLVANRLSGLAASLVFPTAWATTEFAISYGPFASWGSAAYSQYGDLPLLQILSVTGLWGVTFLIGWFAAACNELWEEGLSSTRARQAALLCVGTTCLVMLLGGARIALFPPSSETVRVGSVSRSAVDPDLSDAVSDRMWDGRATDEDMVLIRRWAAARDENLFARAEREMLAGARIVFWGEGNAILMKDDEAAFVARGREMAAKHHVYLGMGLGVLSMGKTRPVENKLVLIEPDGQVAWEYNKAHPVPGPDAERQLRGDGKLRALNTPYGRLSSIICFDADSPQLLAQAGVLRADVMLDPSNDWRAIDPWHTQMASFRAIEQGFSLIRQTSTGLSAAFDYQGRRLAAMDHYQTVDYAMVSEVPTRGVRTIYSRLGNWFAWMCAVGLATLTILSLCRRSF